MRIDFNKIIFFVYIIFISLKTKKVNSSWKKLLYIETERVKREIDYKIDSFQYTYAIFRGIESFISANNFLVSVYIFICMV